MLFSLLSPFLSISEEYISSSKISKNHWKFLLSIFSVPTMNILGLLLLLVLAIAVPIAEAGRRCRSSHQCDYESVCYNGYCYTIDEMFEKFDMKK
ncbi:hypothetical protein B9Z55_010208 [Caenorhabditis nigoni]|uniref:Uncharacterized protein n=1 Tax=Caenorhabditis nigoni TaxID=1611254 RepID=A0A2G5UEU7_9PELO|nr:hypothetical protein B9Z55_010208 [Caenorhabditis nigoni]